MMFETSEPRLLSYYATFKVTKFESLLYEINTFSRKTTTCIGLQAKQIFSVNVYIVFSLWILLHRLFLTIISKVTEQLCWRKIYCDCFRLIWLWLLIATKKRCAERWALKLYRTSLNVKAPLHHKVLIILLIILD